MKTFLSATALILLMAALAVGIWLGSFLGLFIQNHYIWRQKLTVTVETPAGVVSGSSVVEAGWRSGSKIILRDLDRGDFTLSGAALAVEVVPGRWLFVLLPGQDRLFYALLGKDGEGIVDTIPAIRAQHDPLPVPPDRYPMMVTFVDIADPKSVRRVDPDDLAASFGPGVRLKAVTLAVTDEPVTEGKVEAVLGWWLKMRSGSYNEMAPLKLPDKSPRGWEHLGALAFWTLDRVQEFSGRNK